MLNHLYNNPKVDTLQNEIMLFAGHLDSSSEGEDLEQGTCLELPYWVVKALSGRDLAVVDTELPRCV